MTSAYALLALIAAPAFLMTAAHWYAIWAQDKKRWSVVVLEPQVKSVRSVVLEHRKKYKVVVVQSWDSDAGSDAKGYRAHVPLRRSKALRADPQVRKVIAAEHDEFRHPVSHPDQPLRP